MNKNTPERKLVTHTSAALDKSVEALSPEVNARLKNARMTALNPKPKFWLLDREIVTSKYLGASLAFGLCLMVFWTIRPDSFSFMPEINVPINSSFDSAFNFSGSNSELASSLSEFILLSSLDETELEVVEDIEFAYWLSQEFEHEGGFDAHSVNTGMQHNG